VRLRRHAHRTNLYVWAFVSVALLVIVVALAAANTPQVKVNWVIGTSHASLFVSSVLRGQADVAGLDADVRW